MKTLLVILAVLVADTLADGFGSHNHRSGRRGGRRFRQGRQDAAPPPASYGAGGDAAGDALGQYDGEAGGTDNGDASAPADDNLAMLEKSVPGIPGEDYPIYAEVPDTGFACDGQVDGGYYADPEADCQVFHICTADGQGGLAKYSFLCPNGTVFNQNYFICDWWFNFDCAEAEALYSLNDDIAAEREENSQSGAATEPQAAYGAAPPPEEEYVYDYEQEVTEAPLPAYEDEALPDAAPAGGYGAPGEGEGEAAPVATYEADREARNFRGSQRTGRNFRGNGRNGSRNGRRNNRRRPGQRRGRQGRRFRG